MIATRRGLAIVGALALVLLLLVVLDRSRGHVVVDRALVHGLEVDHITSLRWDTAGSEVLAIAPDAGTAGWKFIEPAYGRVDPRALADLLATLRGARWHRREETGMAGATTRRLVIHADDRDHTLRFGRALDGGEQVWILSGDDAVLVDAWVVRSLDPGPLALATRRPFENAKSASMILFDHDGVMGTPRQSRLGQFLVAAPIVDELEQALGALELERLIASPAPDPRAIKLVAGNVSGALGGACPGEPALVQLVASTGAGCVPLAAAERVRAVAAKFRGALADLVEPRPVPVQPTTITLIDGRVLDLRKRALIDGAPADATRVAELLAVLLAPAEVRVGEPPEPTPRARLTLQLGAGALVLEVFADRLVRRDREPVLLELTPEAWAILGRPSRELRDLALWAEDPMTITALEIDGITYARGAVVGEWTRTPAGSIDARAVEALATELARLRAVSADAPAFTSRHRVTLTVTPPVGAPFTHVLEVGAATDKGCPARADTVGGMLARPPCLAIAKLAGRAP